MSMLEVMALMTLMCNICRLDVELRFMTRLI